MLILRNTYLALKKTEVDMTGLTCHAGGSVTGRLDALGVVRQVSVGATLPPSTRRTITPTALWLLPSDSPSTHKSATSGRKHTNPQSHHQGEGAPGSRSQ